MNELLLIEIGGTHTRCAVSSGAADPDRIVVFDNLAHRDPESVIAAYLDGLAEVPPTRAALAVAAPVGPDPLRLTNIDWKVDTARLKRRFGWTAATVINDFEALACAVPVLSDGELFTIRPGEAASGAPIAVLGPGTGLGVSGLVPCEDTWFPISGEGGHVTLAAADEHEAEIIATLRREHRHVSAERVLSGAGLLSLYRLVAEHPRAGSAAAVSRLADAGDRYALDALEQFFRFLGTVCGDIALTMGARGGVYLGGGMLPLMKAHLARSGFAQRFLAKGRYQGYLEQIPVRLIVAENPALRGIPRHPDV
ncbi:MAG: glucokinase [Gammaproteobacteria bacterium]|nr:glucokinase [Gammaproteobacteria bacterium]